ncbi:hypothetical protein CLAFUW4_12942 [Fulvia fulva]|uniref:Uncharacterized protein n=1 Tax=Passalora fulva TaxID=5499 RepID=A0A9Q8PJ81_PASFU|nr:uncharacterized protein CLAFUR5_12807 [Fulvia fulva]KAK4611642.1 hypothetical protein CLAFUR4_12946 [Fulvia fulva]KAK4612790.1 hypothetical protein CLAFUR0_12952 [Fulvia fulva]UJO23416.1 hypothetical protein CLAFUR5_12807 [Fulvia fulva]WPV21538.1 hypothetical protein CLAFUW4_12942 [Fulvia fulva]WPV35868.1 hypothetical protein CLAFUW7_12949 [Fulvia fulva]
MSEDTTRKTRSQTQRKSETQQTLPELDLSIDPPNSDNQNADPQPPQDLPDSNTLEGRLYAAYKRKRLGTADPLDPNSKLSKIQLQNMIEGDAEHRLGYRPVYHEFHDTEIRRGIPLENRVWMTISEEAGLTVGEDRSKYFRPDGKYTVR